MNSFISFLLEVKARYPFHPILVRKSPDGDFLRDFCSTFRPYIPLICTCTVYRIRLIRAYIFFCKISWKNKRYVGYDGFKYNINDEQALINYRYFFHFYSEIGSSIKEMM